MTNAETLKTHIKYIREKQDDLEKKMDFIIQKLDQINKSYNRMDKDVSLLGSKVVTIESIQRKEREERRRNSDFRKMIEDYWKVSVFFVSVGGLSGLLSLFKILFHP